MIKTFILFLIYIYQRFLSTDTGVARLFFVNFLGVSPIRSCKYFPSCSEYTRQAIEKYGILAGIRLGFARVARCRPGNAGGYDPC